MDNIFNSRFIQAGRDPAWHLKGWMVGDERISASEAAFRMGVYGVKKVPLVAHGDGFEMEIPYCIIVRDALPEDPVRRVFGRPVSKDYELIDVERAAEIVDKAYGNGPAGVVTPVETFGVLGKGEDLFITSMVTEFDVLGDEIKTYLLVYSPMYSDKAAVVCQTPVRVVCQNTLVTGIAKASQKFYIDHQPGAATRMELHIRSIHRRIEDNSRMMKESFESMAKIRVKDKRETANLVSQIYNDPPKPEPEWDMQYGITYEAHMEHYAEKVKKVQSVREIVMELFFGMGTGMDTDATQGTRFGVYNAVSEYETYRRGPHDRAAVSLVSGDRSHTIRKAFDVLSK